MNTFNTTIMLPDATEIPVEVTFEWWPAEKGYRDKWGVPLEPDTREELEIQRVIGLDNGYDYWKELTKDMVRELESQCWDRVRSIRL